MAFRRIRVRFLLPVLSVIILLFASVNNTTTTTVTITLVDSSGNALSGGSLRYYDGSWHDAVNNGNGLFSVATPATSLTYEMTYAFGKQTKSNVPVTGDTVRFSTVPVRVELRNSQDQFLDTGTIQYYAGTWNDFGVTSGGQVTMELLPYNYKFRMTYAFASNEKYQDVGTNPTVVFQTKDVAVQLLSSTSAALDTGKVQYYAGSWNDFGATSGGQTNKELLPYNYKFRMTYAFASNEKYQDVTTDPTVIFQTKNVAVQLLSSTSTVLDTGKVQYYAGSWNDFGTTSGGQTNKELLPYNYKFRMTYAFASNEKYQDVTTNPTVVFQTRNVAVQLLSSTSTVLDTGKVQYYAGSWNDFGATSDGQTNKELLPYNYKFRMTYSFVSNEKYQDVTTNPTVIFQTKNVAVQLLSSTSTVLDTGKVQYYAGSWNDFGTTSGGQTNKELLPYNYKFRMTYAFASNEKYQDVTTNQTVVFQTINILVQLKNSTGQLMDPGAVQYYAGSWKEFGATSGGETRRELLPYNYKFRMTHAHASNEKYQDVGTNPTVVFPTVLATVQVQNLQGQPVNGAAVKYYSGNWYDFGSTINGQSILELLPNNYKFRITYNNITEEKWQDLRIQTTATFQIDVPPPAIQIALQVFDPWEGSTTDEGTVLVNGQVNDTTAFVSVNAQNAEVEFHGRFRIRIPLGEGPNTVTVYASNTGSSATVVRTVTYVKPVLPPDPVTVAPAVDSTVVTTMAASTRFLYTGPNPIQTGVNPADMVPRRAAVVRGKVCGREGGPLSNVKVTILDHPEFGQTLSRADGWFDMAVNGGGYLTVKYEKNGYLPLQRQSDVSWQEFTVLDSVVMAALDLSVTRVDLSDTVVQTVRGTTTNDNRGLRQATVLFEPGTQADMVMPDGTSQPLSSLHVRASEYTIGENGPSAMPAALPPDIAYTYCVELTADEALQAGADEVRFSRPVPFYVDNFIGLPAGAGVPVGYYDRKRGVWNFSDVAVVFAITDTTGGIAGIDFNGDNQPEPLDSLALIGMTQAECKKLAALYEPGHSLWRAKMSHFSSWDLNLRGDYATNPKRPNGRPLFDKSSIIGDPCSAKSRSVIGIQNQTLGEDLPASGTGMTLHYQSDRVPGRIPSVEIPISGDSLPDIKRIELTVKIAGRTFFYTYPKQANLIHHFTWDGKDAYGRRIYGPQTITAVVSYIYRFNYSYCEWEWEILYNVLYLKCHRIIVLQEYSIDQVLKTQIGVIEHPKRELGGWGLNVHHAYDMNSKTILLGDGTKRTAENTCHVIQTAMKLTLDDPIDVAPQGFEFGPDGSLYVCQRWEDVVLRMAPDSTVSVFAGINDKPGYNGDERPATSAWLTFPTGVAVAQDGSVYIADFYGNRIRRVDKSGIIHTVAGTGVSGYSGDGGPAVEAGLSYPYTIAVSSYGDVYIADQNNYRIRKVSPDGVIRTLAGTGVSGYNGDNGPGVDAKIKAVYDLEVGPDGSVYFADSGHVVRKISPDGVITTVAGTGTAGYSGDGGPATSARLRSPMGVAVSGDGCVYITDSGNYCVRKVYPDGTITTIAGNRKSQSDYAGEAGPAKLTRLMSMSDIDVGKDGQIYFGEVGTSSVRRLTPIFKGFTTFDFSVPSEDGAEVYHFNSAGRHLKTVDALTGVTLHSFGYNSAGLLTSVTDMDSLVTRIERDSLNNPLAVVSPFGQRTVLDLDTNGYLSGVTNPAGETEHFTYTDKGLMTGRIDPRGNASVYTYDAEGRLVKDEDPAGGWNALAYTPLENGYEVILSTAENRSQKYKVEKLLDGTVRMTNTNESGQAVTALNNTDGSSQVTYPDGTTAFQQSGPDPRFGMEAPITSKATVTSPSGLMSTVTHGRTITQISGLEVTGLADTVTVNGKKTLTKYDGILKMVTTLSPLGKKSISYLDAKGRVVRDSIPGVQSVNYVYNEKGFLTQTQQGDRVTHFTYNAQGRLETVTDPLNRTATMAYDSVGRVLSQTLADGRVIDYSYDANGNLTSLAPPGRPSHAFSHTPVNLTRGYYPPLLPDSTGNTYYFYNLDRQIVQTMFSDSSRIQVVYDTTGCSCGGVGKPARIIYDRGVAQFKYDPVKGNLTQIISPSLDTLKYTYDGSLPKGVTWKGIVNGSVGVNYNNDFQVTSQTVNGGNSVSFGYDNDGLLASVGGLTITRDSQNGLLTGTTLGNVTTGYSYNSLGELTSFQAKYNASDLFKTSYSLDSLGRISHLSEMIGSDTTRFRYFYDLAGRLSRVDCNDTTISIYHYDANGNRLSHATSTDSTIGIYDTQDRMLSYGNATFGYSATSSLVWKTENGDTTRYYYDLMGNLISVGMPDGMQIQYLIDGQNRRVGKIVNGKIVKRWLYQNQLNIVAELDSLGNVASRFVYGIKGHVPDYMVKNGITYQFITDHLGNVRFVVDVASGAVVQYISYDEFGNILTDTNLGFQPFGYAGGLYDGHTGLVRFGARDYDAYSGRWTEKDPIWFAGGNNIYEYCNSSPINLIDVYGFKPKGPKPNSYPNKKVPPKTTTSESREFVRFKFFEASENLKGDLTLNSLEAAKANSDKISVGEYFGVNVVSINVGACPVKGDNWSQVNIGIGDYFGIGIGQNYSVTDISGEPGGYIVINLVGIGAAAPISISGSNP